MAEKIHPIEILEYLAGPRKDDGLSHVFELAEFSDLEEPQHAVGVKKGNAAQVDLFRPDEGLDGLVEGLFGNLGHGRM